MRVTEEQSDAIRFDGTNCQRCSSFQRRVRSAAKAAARILETRQCGDAFTQASGGAYGKQLAQAASVAIFVTRRRAKICIRLPAKSDCGAVEALVGTKQMEATLEPQFD